MKVVIVGCGFPQLGLIRRARALGLEVLGVDANPNAIGVKDCSDFFEISTTEEEDITALCRKMRVKAITTTGSERALTTVAAVAEELDLPFYADVATVRRAQEKDAMREAYAKGGVKIPPFVSTSKMADATRFANAVGYPVVVKPTHGWGQRGVAKVERHGDLASHFEDALVASRNAGGTEVVIEGFLRGGEYSVNGWIEDGALVSHCVTERVRVPGNKPLGVMLAEVYASGLSPEDEAIVVDEARRGAKALGLARGPCYSQVAFDSARRAARLFETAARCGGGFDADVTKLASGVDFYTRLLGIATRNLVWERAGRETPAHGGALVKFIVGKPGKVTHVSTPPLEDGLVAAEVFVRPGDTVHPLTDGSKRVGAVLCHGSTRAEAEARADAAIAKIELVTA